MSSLAQAVYDDFRKARGTATSFCPVVLNSKQERQAGAGWNIHWYTSQNSGKDLWRLKKEKPELFAPQKDVAGSSDAIPLGFEPTKQPGLHYHRERNIYFDQASRKLTWFDEAAQHYREFREGVALPLAFRGGGAASGGPASEKAGGKAPAPSKHVVIADLHRAAQALKSDLSHLDRPMAMLGVFGGDGAERIDLAARGYHQRLVRRLSANRGCWSNEALCEAVICSLDDLFAASGQGQGSGAVPAAAIALTTGPRVVAMSSPGAHFLLFSEPDASRPSMHADQAGLRRAASACLELATPQAAINVALTVGALSLEQADVAPAVLPHFVKGRPRAASVALVRAARGQGATTGPLAAACARLALLPPDSQAEDGPALKRPRTVQPGGGSSNGVASSADQVRVRQILLRYTTAASAARTVDPVRRCPVRRTLEEAEARMLEVLAGIEAEGMSSFPRVCREVSECQSALKGGELAGDLGWLDRTRGADQQQSQSKVAVRPQVPGCVLKAAFELAVGEVHDLVTSDLGVHLMQRTA